jgi:hypothetical protein
MDPISIHRVAAMTLLVDPSNKSWVGGSVVLFAGNQTMAVLSLEPLQSWNLEY